MGKGPKVVISEYTDTGTPNVCGARTKDVASPLLERILADEKVCQITQCVPAVVSEAACHKRERERKEQIFPLKKRNLAHFLNSVVLFLFIKKNFSFKLHFFLLFRVKHTFGLACSA